MGFEEAGVRSFKVEEYGALGEGGGEDMLKNWKVFIEDEGNKTGEGDKTEQVKLVQVYINSKGSSLSVVRGCEGFSYVSTYVVYSLS